MDLDLEDVITDAYPVCPRCGEQLDTATVNGEPVWDCPACGAVAISR